jgi:quercetin dioxygenase-like cupin family protein
MAAAAGPVSQDAVIVPGLASLVLDQSQPVIYDRPIGLKLLFQDPASGAEHYLVRYPAGMTAQSHTHTAAHTIIVLEGKLQANGKVLGPGSYCHFPPGSAMHHGPAGEQDCLFVTIFHGPFDVYPAE